MIRITKPYKDDMLMPVSVMMIGDELNIDVYEQYLPIANEYLQRFEGDYFGTEALTFLSDNILPEGYLRLDDVLEYYIVMTVNEIICWENSKVTDLDKAKYLIDETEFEADIIKENGQPASVIVENGRIAAISASNYFIEDGDDEVELAVETIPEFREKKYGKAVLSHMANKVIAMNKTVTYRTSCFNVASLATAKSCGFYEIGKEYYLNCYKEE